MDTADFLSAVEREGRAFLAAGALDPIAPVEHCPDWDVEGLVRHVVGVWAFMTAQVEAADPNEMVKPERDSSSPAERLDRLVAALSTAEPSAPCWNWCPPGDRTAAWVARRMAHETAVHRWDAENAVGEAAPLDAELACDGVDEILDVAWRYQMGGPVTDFPTSTLHLHRTDGEGEWLLSAGDEGLIVTHEHAKGDAAARGTASDLALLVWGRRMPGIEVFGDEADLAAWLALAP
ncbi:MAG: maleylpyruvate isomerase family mycothiol-dependent enzyme [Actinomycetota bacterium]|nr:maleylpyruvate isomerase family mycothiol-dependent enzyme [Actinomycetota bacterium]